jgi:hypothetical protein
MNKFPSVRKGGREMCSNVMAGFYDIISDALLAAPGQTPPDICCANAVDYSRLIG